MSKYKITLTLEVEDKHEIIAQSDVKEVEKEFASGYEEDEAFSNVTCKVEKV